VSYFWFQMGSTVRSRSLYILPHGDTSSHTTGLVTNLGMACYTLWRWQPCSVQSQSTGSSSDLGQHGHPRHDMECHTDTMWEPVSQLPEPATARGACACTNTATHWVKPGSPEVASLCTQVSVSTTPTNKYQTRYQGPAAHYATPTHLSAVACLSATSCSTRMRALARAASWRARAVARLASSSSCRH
jgi:hypothetical protein